MCVFRLFHLLRLSVRPLLLIAPGRLWAARVASPRTNRVDAAAMGAGARALPRGVLPRTRTLPVPRIGKARTRFRFVFDRACVVVFLR